MLNSRMFRRLSAPMLLLTMLGCSAQNGPQATGTANNRAQESGAIAAPAVGSGSCRAGNAVDMYIGTYTVVAVENYGGGLTTEAAAKSRIGQDVVVSKDTFKVRDTTIARPSYSIACYPMPKREGEVPVDRWSNFYGFGTDRSVVEVLEVQDPALNDSAPEFHLEVVKTDEGIELWELYDGWLFRLVAGE